MNITLYRSNSENNAISKRLETIANYANATARNAFDVINPVIMIESNNIGETNYAYIKENNRYYFVTGIEKTRVNMYTLSLHVDVLMSFRDDLLMQNAIISRSNGLWDSYLPDSKSREKQYTRNFCYLLRNSSNSGLFFQYTGQPLSILITAG